VRWRLNAAASAAAAVATAAAAVAVHAVAFAPWAKLTASPATSGPLLASALRRPGFGARAFARRLQVGRSAVEEADDGGNDDSINVELFRQSLIQGWGGGVVGGSTMDVNRDWATILNASEVRAGDLIMGDPAAFLEGEGGDEGPRRVGLKGRVMSDWPTREKLRMMPVVLLTRVDTDRGTAEGLWLTMRTGRLMGDFVSHFQSRPLLYGGPEEAGLTMVHPYPQVPGSEVLGENGLYIGGEFTGAQDWVEEGEGSSLRFRFFMNQVRWGPGEFAAELAPGSGRSPWIPVRCNSDLVLSEVDSSDDMPLWLRVARLAGGAAEEAARKHNLDR